MPSLMLRCGNTAWWAWKWPSRESEAGYGVDSCCVGIWSSHQTADGATAWAGLVVQRDTCTKDISFRLTIPDAVLLRMVQNWSAVCFLRIFCHCVQMAWTRENRGIYGRIENKYGHPLHYSKIKVQMYGTGKRSKQTRRWVQEGKDCYRLSDRKSWRRREDVEQKTLRTYNWNSYVLWHILSWDETEFYTSSEVLVSFEWHVVK